MGGEPTRHPPLVQGVSLRGVVLPEHVQGGPGGCLLGLLLVPAGGARVQLRANGDLHLEGLLVVRPGLGHHPVARGHLEPRLRVLLELRLVVQAAAPLGHAVQGLGEVLVHQHHHRLHPRPQEHRAHDGLQGIGQQGVLLPPARHLLAAPQQEQLPQAQPPGDARQPFLVDDEGPKLGQLPFRGQGEALHQPVADGQVHHRIPQELQPLVVLEPRVPVLVEVALVGEGRQPQVLAEKRHPQPGFQRLDTLLQALLLHALLLWRVRAHELHGLGRHLQKARHQLDDAREVIQFEALRPHLALRAGQEPPEGAAHQPRRGETVGLAVDGHLHEQLQVAARRHDGLGAKALRQLRETHQAPHAQRPRQRPGGRLVEEGRQVAREHIPLAELGQLEAVHGAALHRRPLAQHLAHPEEALPVRHQREEERPRRQLRGQLERLWVHQGVQPQRVELRGAALHMKQVLLENVPEEQRQLLRTLHGTQGEGGQPHHRRRGHGRQPVLGHLEGDVGEALMGDRVLGSHLGLQRERHLDAARVGLHLQSELFKPPGSRLHP
ncbi:hypothetical protein STIAU_6519 [Stigmatella aurantiaca DW4/3-1]|uniref:Uncharacterized protein n=1 Tax=Stigmatella aurantiaca (strain DW4/3-1) TaxID=378806 RepID=Q08V38_STIAD|nr:hypothetical protein STIAU_6519 [Stigmatella aurantiaca DW4/3-1]